MQVFLGDQVTLTRDIDEDTPVFITGQVAGVVLNDKKQLERVWIHGIESSFWMSAGWKFIEEEYDNEGDNDGEI